jgi:hypothetical protein
LSAYYYTTKADAWEFSFSPNKKPCYLDKEEGKKIKKVLAFPIFSEYISEQEKRRKVQ